MGKMADATEARPKAKAADTREEEEDLEGSGPGEGEESETWALTEEQKAACKTMFEKLTLYLNGELTGQRRSVHDLRVAVLMSLLRRVHVCSIECGSPANSLMHDVPATYLHPSPPPPPPPSTATDSASQ